MAPTPRTRVRQQDKIKWDRIKKIMALVPPENAASNDDNSSGSEPEDIRLQDSANYQEILSDVSSEPRSIPSSLERLNLLDSSDDEHATSSRYPQLSDEDTVPLTPVIQRMFPVNNLHEQLPTLNSVSSILSPSTLSPIPQTRSKRQATTTLQPRLIVKRKRFVPKPLKFKWNAGTFQHRAIIEPVQFSTPLEAETPIDYFLLFFSEDIFKLITEQTNLYSVQSSQTSRCCNLDTNDVKDFIALTLLMGVVSMPSYRDYWSNNLRYPPIADVMTLKKYENIRKHLHFVDNSIANEDRYYKIRPLVELVRQNCLKLEEEVRYSIDEMMVPYKGTRAGSRRQYLPKKPKKWGFKMFVRAGVSGLVYDFLLYAGEDTFRFDSFNDYEEGLGVGAKVVLVLAKTIKNKPSVLYFDNFFTSLELIRLLREEHGIFSLGTIRNNRLRGCQEKLPTDKQLLKKGRGATSQVVCKNNKLVVVKWKDNKIVTLASSFVDSHPMESIKRYCKLAKRKVDVDCPQIVKQYNTHMGGVDLADMLVALYRSDFKTKRWYMAIFSQILDICVNNAWLLYRRKQTSRKYLPLKKFRILLATELLKKDRVTLSKDDDINIADVKTIKTPSIPRPPDAVRFDNTGHLPVFTTYGRCKWCKNGFTNMKCTKCEMRLCLVAKRNCFFSFHVNN